MMGTIGVNSHLYVAKVCHLLWVYPFTDYCLFNLLICWVYTYILKFLPSNIQKSNLDHFFIFFFSVSVRICFFFKRLLSSVFACHLLNLLAGEHTVTFGLFTICLGFSKTRINGSCRIKADHAGSTQFSPDQPGSSQFFPDQGGSSQFFPDQLYFSWFFFNFLSASSRC